MTAVCQSSNLFCGAGRRTSLINAFVNGNDTQRCPRRQQQQGYSSCQRQSRLSRRSCRPRFVRLVAWKNPEGLHLLSKIDNAYPPIQRCNRILCDCESVIANPVTTPKLRNVDVFLCANRNSGRLARVGFNRSSLNRYPHCLRLTFVNLLAFDHNSLQRQGSQ